MAGKPKLSSRKNAKAPQTLASSPIRMIVRRGALKRFDALKKKTAHLQVEVEWDRREAERRKEPCLSDSERRGRDRRGVPPFTWDLADFVVVTPKNNATPTKPEKPQKIVPKRRKTPDR